MAALYSVRVNLHIVMIILVGLSYCVVSGYTSSRKPIEINSDGGYDFLLALHENLDEDEQLLQSIKVKCILVCFSND